jgi:hypothetical protein
MGRLPATALLGLMLCCTGATAHAATSTPADVPDTVHVNAIKNPEMRTYRSAEAGFEAYDDYRKLAPSAPLRFRLLHAGGGPATAADGLLLKLQGNDWSTAIPIDAAGRFGVPRSQAAHDDDALFVLNQKNGLYAYRADIRTPGLAENVRRLGDLRLECHVNLAVAKEKIPFWARALVNTVLLTSDWCGKEQVHITFPAERKLVRATLREGGKSDELKVEGVNYHVPLTVRGWTDEALIELEYAADETAGTAP